MAVPAQVSRFPRGGESGAGGWGGGEECPSLARLRTWQEPSPRPSATELARLCAAGDRAILSTDAGVYLLPPPVEAFREYLMLVESEGFSETEIRRMIAHNPAELFRIGQTKD